MGLKTRLVYWLIKALLSLLVEETGGKSSERIDRAAKEAEEALMDAHRFARTTGDKAREKRYLAAVVGLWTLSFEIKRTAGAKVRLPKIKVVWPANE